MKNIKTILIVAATVNILHAQDTIYTKNGSAIPAKVYEITQHEIRYQKASNLEGPIYTIDKNSVSLIEYKNGTKDVFSGNATTASQPNNNNNSSNNYNGNSGNYNGNNYSDDVYNQGQQVPVTNNYYNSGYSSGYYNPGVSMNFMLGLPSLFWGVPMYAGAWGGWPYYRSYYRPYWAFNYYRPWGGGYGYGGYRGYGYGGYGWGGGYGWRGVNRGGFYAPRGGYTGFHGGGFNGGGFHGSGGFHGGGGGFHGGGGGFHGGGGHGGGGHGGHR